MYTLIFKIYRKLEIQQLIIKHKSVSLSKDLNINVLKKIQ